MTDTTETNKVNTEAQKVINALILDELQSYPRFCLWVEANYQIHLLQNDEERRIEVKVIEEDIVHAQQKLTDLLSQKTKDAPQVQLASSADLDKLKKL